MNYYNRENEAYIMASEYEVLKLMIEFPHRDFKGITENSFPHKTARSLFKAIASLNDNDEVITNISLLREGNKLDDKIDSTLINYLMSTEVDESNIEGAVSTLDEGSLKCALDLKIEKLRDITSSNNPVSQVYATSLISEMQELVASKGKKTKALTLEEAVDLYEEELKERALGNRYPTGDEFLDEQLTRKFAPGQVITIAGATGTGKSAVCLNLINKGINLGIPTIDFTLEMDTVSTMDRLVSMRTGIPISEWYNKDNITSLLPVLKKEREALEGKPFVLIDDPAITLAGIQYQIRDFKAIHKVDYAVVYIDLVTMVSDFMNLKNGGTLANAIENSINRLNAIAKKENVCIIAVVQFNRTAELTRVDSIEDINSLRPTLAQIKNSGAIGERSRVVLSVFRPKYYAVRLLPDDPNSELMTDELQIQVLKQSQGRVGQIGRYLFEGETMGIVPRSPEDLEDEAVPGTENIQY